MVASKVGHSDVSLVDRSVDSMAASLVVTRVVPMVVWKGLLKVVCSAVLTVSMRVAHSAVRLVPAWAHLKVVSMAVHSAVYWDERKVASMVVHLVAYSAVLTASMRVAHSAVRLVPPWAHLKVV